MQNSVLQLGGPWDAAIVGKLDQFRDDVRVAWLESTREAVTKVGRRGQDRLRAELVSNGLEGLKNTWRLDVFPKSGLAYEPSVILYSSADVIVSSFDEGATIRSRSGGLVAVPIPGSPAEDFPNPRGPDDKVDFARQRFGDQLKVIPANARRPAMLVVEGAGFTKSGRLSRRKRLKSGRFGKGAATVPLFFLLKEVRLGKRLDVQARFDEISKDFSETFPAELGQALRRKGLTG